MMAGRNIRNAAAVLIIGLAVLGGATALAAEPPTEELTLAAAVRRAVESHPALKAAVYQEAAATARVDQARAGFFPRLDFSEGVTQSDNPVYAFGSLLNQGRFTAADFALDKLNNPGAITNWRTNLTGNLPLFVGGRTYLGYQQAQLGHESVGLGKARLAQEVTFGVVRAYAAILLSQEALTTVEASLRTAEANLAAAQARHETGMVVASDALAARVRVARLKEEAIAAANQVRRAQAALSEAMGLPQDREYRVAGQLELPASPPDQPAALREIALQHRADYRQALLEEQRLDKDVLKAKGALLPTLHVMGNYEINNLRLATEGQDSWSVGVMLNLNLFNGGADRARIAEAQAQRARVAALRERLANAIELESRDAFLAHQTARERIGVAREAVTAAEESLRIVKDRYEAGLTTIVELLDSETALTAARTGLTRTLYDATVSRARLELSLGRLDHERF
jgi:outer membrane protein TolC